MTWPRMTIKTSAGTLSYHRTGGDKPTAILIHGLTDNSLCWTRVTRSLMGHFDVIMMDSPGHGYSDLPDESAVEKPAETIASLIDALQVSAPVVIGHSIGALAAADFASNYPLVPAGLILEDPPFRQATPTAVSPQQLNGFQKEVSSMKAMAISELVAMGRQRYPDWHDLDLAAWAEAKHQVNADVLSRYHFKPWIKYVEPIRIPTLLLHGTPGADGIVTPEIATQICAANTFIRSVQVEDAGHQIHRTHFDTYVSIIGEFLGIRLGDHSPDAADKTKNPNPG